ncbi:hypothetical protein HY967_00010 [Candidatus Jorgensenbacteria bacterium]|nr:hypothetical protein [Candidatus Jorgensenbacteria bacterium]
MILETMREFSKRIDGLEPYLDRHPILFSDLQKLLWSFQGPDGIYKVESRKHDPWEMDKVMTDDEAFSVVLHILHFAKERVMKPLIGEFDFSKDNVDFIVIKCLEGQWLGDREIAKNLLRKAESYLGVAITR